MSESPSTAKGIVKNPLTVIAIFAGLAEVSATIALPQLNENVQSTFVWFVMGFPTFLVSLFFLTLWVKHHVLYAPSDFSDEDNFMKHWLPSPPTFSEEVSNISESENESAQELAPPSEPEISKQITRDLPPTSDVESATEAQSARMRMMLSRRAEDLAISWVTTDLRLKFVRDVALKGLKELRYDAVAYGTNGPVMIEVKYLTNSIRSFKFQLNRELEKVQRVINTLNKNELIGAKLILFFVSEIKIEPYRVNNMIQWALTKIKESNIQINIDIKFKTLEELEKRAAQ